MFAIHSVRPLQALCCLQHVRIGWATTRCGYARGSRGGMKSGLGEDFGLQEELEDIEGTFAHQLDNPNIRQEAEREEKRLRQKIMYKMIERKYFKKPQELNLLTWDAKEQIRFLNHEFPDEWTVDKLAQSFPISRDGVIKILKSKFTPKTFKEIIDHDERVLKHWESLKTKDGPKGGPIMNRYENLQKEGRLYTLANAGGIPGLPKPDITRTLLPFQNVQKKKAPGTFESIVKDYCERKAKQNAKDETQKKSDGDLYRMHVEGSKKLLGDVTLTLIPKSKDSASPGKEILVNKKTVKSPTDSQMAVDYGAFVSQEDSEGFKAEPDHPNLKVHERQTMLDASLSSDKELYKNTRMGRVRRLHRRTAPDPVHPDCDVQDQLEILQMQGTGKIPNIDPGSSSLRNPERDVVSLDKLAKENASIGWNRNDPYQDMLDSHQPEERVLDALQYDPSTETAYMFEEGTGYQHPLGKTDNSLDKIKVPQHIKGKGQVFKKGPNYYDEDGEFLYRVPGEY